MVKIIETPRDGFQGLQQIISTKNKIDYINLLLKCGFDTVEVGSFVSPRIIPQMADTEDVLRGIDSSGSNVAVLVATENAGFKAAQFNQVDKIFFPFAISPKFLKKNINQTIEQAERTIDSIQNVCVKNSKELIVYFSMGFGSDYGDSWSMELLYHWLNKMISKDLTTFPFSDILGNATPKSIGFVFNNLLAEFPNVEFGLHLHSRDNQRIDKVNEAFKAGVRRFDTVLNGLGGCPQTGKELVGNLPLDSFVGYCNNNNIKTSLNENYLKQAREFNLYS